MYNPKTRKNILTKDMTFLQKSYKNWSKVKKPVIVSTSYVDDDEEEVKMAPENNKSDNNKYNVVSYSKSND